MGKHDAVQSKQVGVSEDKSKTKHKTPHIQAHIVRTAGEWSYLPDTVVLTPSLKAFNSIMHHLLIAAISFRHSFDLV